MIQGRAKWRALSCKWRWQTTSALGGDGDSEGGCQGSENETATPLQPLDRMKKERETGVVVVAGCLREGGSSTWVQNGRHKPPSSSSQRQGDTGATVPIEVFVSRALSCFSSANRGYNEGGMLPSPRAKGLSILDLSDPEWPNQPSHENQVNDLLPLALLLVKWVTAIISISKTGRERGSFLTCCWGDFASDSASSYKMHLFLRCELTVNDLIVADST